MVITFIKLPAILKLTNTIKSLFIQDKYPRWRIINFLEISNNHHFINDLYSGNQQGFLIKNFLTKSESKQLLESFNKWSKDVIISLSFGRTIGKTLMGSPPDLKNYLKLSEIFNKELNKQINFSFRERILNLFENVSGNRGVQIPVKDKLEYSIANIRDLYPNQGGLHAHVGNEFVGQYSELFHLGEIANLYDQLSYFVVLQKPEIGGSLIIYDLDWEHTPDEMIDGTLLYYSEQRNKELERYSSFALHPEEGDLILFTGGKVWHRIEDIKGTKSRVTIGGFAAKSKDDKKIFVWS